LTAYVTTDVHKLHDAVFLEQLIVAKLVKKFPAVMEPDVS